MSKAIGTQVVPFDLNELPAIMSSISDGEVEVEMADDLAVFETASYDEDAHKRTARMDLMVRRWVEKNGLNAYSMNFADIERKSGYETVPFIEASKSMARGIGYAGEGDVLTASLCGALLQAYPETSFTEMFCPDWKGNSIFLSHMGEMNPVTAKGKMDLTAKEYGFSDVDAPLMAYGCFKAGDAVLVNLAQTSEGEFTLILSKVEVLDGAGDVNLKESIRGWIKPDMPLSTFLEKYSMAGGTHHLVMVYGDALKFLSTFGQMMGFSVEFI
jgi:L-arabinose isomerase